MVRTHDRAQRLLGCIRPRLRLRGPVQGGPGQAGPGVRAHRAPAGPLHVRRHRPALRRRGGEGARHRGVGRGQPGLRRPAAPDHERRGRRVSAIFKVLQLDPGFPHHYMDVHYELVDEKHGYFELAYCGALMDAEPFGDAMVTNMCHHIEDGTFDVTAQAVNPKAHIRHVHRPPRVPTDRVPHCRWEIVIEDDTETLPEKDITKITRMTTAATFTFPDMKDGTPHIPPAPDA